MPTSNQEETSMVKVKHWNCYSSSVPTSNSHQIDVQDDRKTSGQTVVSVGALEGNPDDMMQAIAEINTNPLNGIDHVPCVHLHFDGDNLAASFFKVGDKILLRLDASVTLTPVQGVGKAQSNSMFWIE